MAKSKVDWDALSPQEIWDAIHSAPQVAGPWQKAEYPASDGFTYGWRHAATGGTVVWVGPEERTSDDDEPVCVGYFTSREDADEELRLNGWLLVD